MSAKNKAAPLPPTPLSDEEVIARASKGMLGAIFQRLIQGDDAHYSDTAKADLGFVQRLAFFTRDEAQIVRIWKASKRWGLDCREEGSYVRKTVRAAIGTQDAYRDPNFRDGKPGLRSDFVPTDEATGTIPLKQLPPPPPPNSPRKPQPPEPAKDNLDCWEVSAADLKEAPVEWFVEPYVFSRELHLLSGYRGTGKSVFCAWLVSLARRTIYLPGHEGSIEGTLLPRLRSHGVDPLNVRILGGYGWKMPTMRERLLERVRNFGANLLICDPADRYVERQRGIDWEECIRAALEAFQWIAQTAGITVLVVRNPGKDKANKVRGHMVWQDVPRRILLLEEGVGDPPRNFLHCDKEGRGTCPPDRYYEHEWIPGQSAPRFRLAEEVQASEAEAVGAIKDAMERKKTDVACDIIQTCLQPGRQEACVIGAKMKDAGISPGIMYIAAHKLGIVMKSEGGGDTLKHWWYLPSQTPFSDQP